ncbi:hypothetical protein DCAR_0624518 [Daucus carota subsp. sativus]|uniref:Uncharacterized protein n=1 Tax=Daucus carota subsp. sativus TaxID=79200 RepID=A0A161YDV2_DAUCS|nr:hypothetical protein DCAR_0624518 [Daucus carota subsp. sativus]
MGAEGEVKCEEECPGICGFATALALHSSGCRTTPQSLFRNARHMKRCF